jgi:hypothetical protein
MKILTLGLALVLSLLSFSRTSHAGYTSSAGAGCQSSSTGGSCTGTFKGFNEAADPFAYVEFEMITINSGAFYAYYNYKNYSCSLTSSSPFVAELPMLMNYRGWFSITWDSTGYCTSMTLLNSSSYLQK